jgi:anti-anti-sigma factor
MGAMTHVFDLPADFNIYRAQATQDALKQWLAQNQTEDAAVLTLSAAQVTDMDSTGLQLLAALRNSGYRLRIVDASRKFTEACEITGNLGWLDAGDTP